MARDDYATLSAITVCNHVHLLDSALVGLALFRADCVPNTKENTETFWLGNIVKLLEELPYREI